MVRKLRALGCALVATFALVVVLAPTALAQQGKLTADGPVTLVGGEVPGAGILLNSQTGAFAVITCPGSTGTGHKYNATPHELVPNGSTTFTMTPHLSINCKAHIPILGTRPVTVTLNGCDFVGHIGETTGQQPKEGGTFAVSASLVCPAGKVMETHIYKSGMSHADADSICTTKVPPQGPFSSGAHLTSTSALGILDIKGTFTGIHTENSGTLCGTGTVSNSQLHFETTIEGRSLDGLPTPIMVTD